MIVKNICGISKICTGLMDVHTFSEAVCFSSILRIITCGTYQEIYYVGTVAIDVGFDRPLCAIEGGKRGALLNIVFVAQITSRI